MKTTHSILLFLNLMKEKKKEILKQLNVSQKRKKRKHNTQTVVDTIEKKINSCSDIRKNRMLIEFNEYKSSSVKSIAVKANTSIKCTTRFMSEKLLMFAKLSLKSFIYSLVELLSFPEENLIVSKIYEKYEIEKI